jgi:murein L,D-transpeptidase YafK
MGRLLALMTLLATSFLLGGCMGGSENVSVKPLSREARAELRAKGMRATAPMLVRIFKDEAELEVWKERDDGVYALFKTYPICAWSGELGPKLKEGDRQAPEGFYVIAPGQMNPNSEYHLAFNLGYPNQYDQHYGRTGAHLMVHGDCSSRGCYAMTNPQIEEIYALAREAFKGGQQSFPVHAFPFRMTPEKMANYKGHEWYGFWQNIKEGYDYFESAHVLPVIGVKSGRYVFGPETGGPVLAGFGPDVKPIRPPKWAGGG